MESVDNSLLKALFVEDLDDGFEWMAQLVQKFGEIGSRPDAQTIPSSCRL